MHFTLLTLFPEMFPGALGHSLAGKALEKGLWSYEAVDIRDFADDSTIHKSVDDTPYGGGAGMVIRPDVIGKAIESVIARSKATKQSKSELPLSQKSSSKSDVIPAYAGITECVEDKITQKATASNFQLPTSTDKRKIIYPSPRGKRLNQRMIEGYNQVEELIILCGRYEGVDQRVLDAYEIEEVSIGDYILSGGEIAAITIIDACIRKLDGVIGNADTHFEESFASGEFENLLEYPLYTRPDEWQGRKVPDVLKSGNHAEIARWRKEAAEKITKERRPDLWSEFLKGEKEE